MTKVIAAIIKIRFKLHLIYIRCLALCYEILGYGVYHGLVLQAPDGAGVLIFGNPHTGKTYLAVELLTHHKYMLVADDLVVLHIQHSKIQAKITNNSSLIAKQGRNLCFINTIQYQPKAKAVEVERIYTLDVYENYGEYLISKIYFFRRAKKLRLQKLLLQKHAALKQKLEEIKPENIQQA